MTRLADLLADNPILLLCVLLAVGSMIGALSFRRFSLGPAAVLFLALALSAYDERLKLPAIIGTLGLVLFAYTIGVSAGPSFFASLRTGGRAIVGVVVSLYYYFGVIRAIYWSKEPADVSPLTVSLPLKLSLGACIAGMLYLGIYPATALNLVTVVVRDWK